MKIQSNKTNRIIKSRSVLIWKTPHVSWTVTDTKAKKQLWARVGSLQNGRFRRDRF